MKPLVAAVATALSLLTVALLGQQPAPALPYTVITRAGRQPLATRTIGGQEMFALDDLARLFNVAVREDALAGALTVTAGSETIVLSPQQPLASIAGRMISLSAAPVREGRTWFVPVDFVTRALAPALPMRVDLRKTSRLVIVGDVRIPRVAARVEPLGSLTRLTIDVAPAASHTVTQDAAQHLIIRFDADALDTADLRPIAPTDTLTGLHATETPPVITLDLGPRFAAFRAADQPGPNGTGRIVIDLPAQTEGAPAQTPAVPSAPPPPPTAAENAPLLDLAPAGGMHAIVIDPGHGGDDEGVKGAQGAVEKTITLNVARRLKAALEARLGVRVLLTREGDQNVAPDQRAAFANNNKADLFVSLHANASLRPSVTGVQVWYASPDGSGAPSERAGHAGAESLPVIGGGSREIDVIPWEQAQTGFIERSGLLARTIDAALRQRVAMAPAGVRQAPLRVLVGVNMPAVLVEMGFLSNPEQDHQLLGDDYQNLIVQGLLDAIVRFRASQGSGT